MEIKVIIRPFTQTPWEAKMKPDKTSVLHKITPTKLVSWFLLALGLIALAFIGLGLTFWGSALTVALLIVILFYQALLKRQEMLSLLKLHEKLPEQDQQLLDAIRIAQKTGNPTTTNIATQLQQLTKTSTPPQ